MSDTETKEQILHCSFCGMANHQVEKLVAGPKVFICNECVRLCSEIIGNEPAADGKVRANCKLCGLLEITEEMKSLDDRGYICENCISFLREKIIN